MTIERLFYKDLHHSFDSKIISYKLQRPLIGLSDLAKDSDYLLRLRVNHQLLFKMIYLLIYIC